MSNEYNLGSLHTVLVYDGLVTRRRHYIPPEDPSRIISFQQRRVMTVRWRWADWLKTNRCRPYFAGARQPRSCLVDGTIAVTLAQHVVDVMVVADVTVGDDYTARQQEFCDFVQADLDFDHSGGILLMFWVLILEFQVVLAQVLWSWWIRTTNLNVIIIWSNETWLIL